MEPEQKSSKNPVVAILILVIVAVGGYFFLGNQSGGVKNLSVEDAKNSAPIEQIKPAVETPVGGEVNVVATGNPDEAVDAIIAASAADAALTDADVTDAALVGIDGAEITGLSDAYDTTNI